MRLFKWSAGFALACMLVACGGGGGNPGSSSGGTGGGGTGGTGGTTPTLSLSALSATNVSLPSGGETVVTTTVRLGGAATSANVSFTATCGRINGMSGSVGTTSSSNGLSSVTYTAVQADGSLCSGFVSITASAAGAADSTLTISVAAPTPNAVTFVSATPAQIFLAGTGTLEQSVVRFRVLSSGTAVAGANVVLSIASNPGGVGLNMAGSLAPVNATTDPSGEVAVTVFSGAIPGPVRVRATLASNPTFFAESQNLTVASGPPSQERMSLAVSTFNIEGQDRDGTSTSLTVRLADRQGNPVDDGTVVNFTAEGGQVVQSCATVRVAGTSQCSVNFVSQEPRPAGGRVSVLAYTNGAKQFTDSNGNNRFDVGDALMNIGDAYRDDNESNGFEGGEFVLGRGGALACVGAGGSAPSRANTCDAGLSTVVRRQTVILFSSTNPVLSVVSQSLGRVTFRLRSAGNTLLPMPAGTTIAATASGGTCAVSGGVQGTPVVNVQPGNNPNADLSTFHAVDLTGCAAGNNVRFTVTSPAGLATIINVGL